MKTHLIGMQATHDTGMDPLKLIPLLKKNGFDATFTKLGSAAERAAWADAIAQNGLIYASIHAPIDMAPSLWTDTLEGDDGEKRLCDAIDACAEVAAELLVVHPYMGFLPSYAPTQTGLDRFRRLADYAEKRSVRLAIENVEGEVLLGYLLNGLSDFPSVGFCLDSGHELCYNRGRDLLADFSDRLSFLHINSNMGVTSPDGHLSALDDAHMLPFDGLVDIEHLAKRLKACAYDGILMLEVKRFNQKGRSTNSPYLAMSDEEYVAEAARRIKKIREMIEQTV